MWHGQLLGCPCCAGRIPGFFQSRQSDGDETVRLWRRQTQGHKSADVFHPRRCRRCTARSHFGNVQPEGRRDFWRHATAFGIEISHFARRDTRHADGAHARHRPDGKRLSRRQAVKQNRKPRRSPNGSWQTGRTHLNSAVTAHHTETGLQFERSFGDATDRLRCSRAIYTPHLSGDGVHFQVEIRSPDSDDS